MSASFTTRLQATFPFLQESRVKTFLQFMRFCLVGCLNTFIDIAVFALLAWRFPTSNVWFVLLYNSLGCIAASINSFYWNKYWTFRVKQTTTSKELMRFALIALGSMAIHDAIVLGVSQTFPIFITGGWLWTNGLKVCAILGTMLLSFISMRLWVFARRAGETHHQKVLVDMDSNTVTLPDKFNYSLSVILPAYNEEAAIAETVLSTVSALSSWMSDFEVIVVNDGSKDCTREIVENIV